jgi:predicted CoA-binding protein
MNSFSILQNVKSIAVIGLSNNPDRSSYGVAKYLEQYFKIYPVNPMIDSWNGIKSYKSLTEIPEKIDLVNVFRKSEEVLPIVQEAINLKIKKVWLQLGVINNEAKELAVSNNIEFVMDECIAVVHRLNYLSNL